MSRDHKKVRAFSLADDLAVAVYRATADFLLKNALAYDRRSGEITSKKCGELLRTLQRLVDSLAGKR